jgi:signal transduction histidine kinase
MMVKSRRGGSEPVLAKGVPKYASGRFDSLSASIEPARPVRSYPDWHSRHIRSAFERPTNERQVLPTPPETVRVEGMEADRSTPSASTTSSPASQAPSAATSSGNDHQPGSAPRAVTGERDWFDEFHSEPLRSAAAHVASSVAHALGSPLNVISGRAEMIRRDPANALNQLTRIEQQVQKIATGLREIVDYLALAEPAREVAPLDAVLEELDALVRPVAESQGQTFQLALTGQSAIVVDRRHVIGTLSSLSRMAIRTCAIAHRSAPAKRTVQLVVSIQPQWIMFELSAPGLPPEQGWQLEQFHARPSGEFAEAYQTLSVSGALVRGLGGRLQLEALPDAVSGSSIRWSYRRHDTAEPDLHVRNAHS